MQYFFTISFRFLKKDTEAESGFRIFFIIL